MSGEGAMRGWIQKLFRRDRKAGQAATELMLTISVISVATVAGAYTFVPQFRGGVNSLASDVEVMLSTHQINVRGGGTGSATSPTGSGTSTTMGGPQASGPGGPSIADDANVININDDGKISKAAALMMMALGIGLMVYYGSKYGMTAAGKAKMEAMTKAYAEAGGTAEGLQKGIESAAADPEGAAQTISNGGQPSIRKGVYHPPEGGGPFSKGGGPVTA